MTPAPYDLAPLLAILGFGALLALLPFAWVWRRDRAKGLAARLQALTVLTLFPVSYTHLTLPTIYSV